MDELSIHASGEALDSSFKEDPVSQKKTTLMQRIFPTGFKHEFVELLKYSWPIVFTQMFSSFVRIAVIMFVGHLGKMELGGATMAISLANVIGNSISIGLIAACDTYFSQSYGSPNKFQVGIYLQTAISVSFLCCVVASAVLLNTQNILLKLGQEPEISLYAEKFIHVFIPALIFIALYQLMVRYLIVQGIVFPGVVIGFLANILNAVLQYVFIYVVNWGLQGSSLGMILAYFLMGFGLLTYAVVSKVYQQTWSGWSRESLIEWGGFMKLGMFSLMMISIEWWTFEISFFLMGILGAVELGASSILYQLWSFASSFPKGSGSACAYRVGRYLGAGRVKGAITAARVSIVFAYMLALIFAVFFFSLRYQLPRLFTTDPDVLELSIDMLPILALFTFFGAAKELCAGICRGMGKQVLGGCVSFVAFFVCAMPIGIPLMFYTSVRAAGFWWGLNIGLAIACVSLMTIVMRVDWEAESEEALKRAKCKVRRKEKKKPLVEDGLMKEASYGSIEISITTTVKHSAKFWRLLFVKRSLITLLCFALLVFGFVCRFVLFIPPGISSAQNITVNSTSTLHSLVMSQ